MRHGDGHFDESDNVLPSARRPDACVAAAFGIALRAARHRRCMSITQLADQGGFDLAHASSIDRGIREPSLADFLRLSIAVGTAPARLLEDTLNACAGPRFGRVDVLRVRGVWIAFSSALSQHPQEDRMFGGSLAARLLDELAKQGLTIVSLPVEPPEAHGHA